MNFARGVHLCHRPDNFALHHGKKEGVLPLSHDSVLFT